MKKKRIQKTKQQLLLQRKCDEIATKNVNKFLKGEVSIDDLTNLLFKKKEENKNEED